jgi:hypothetical protein
MLDRVSHRVGNWRSLDKESALHCQPEMAIPKPSQNMLLVCLKSQMLGGTQNEGKSIRVIRAMWGSFLESSTCLQIPRRQNLALPSSSLVSKLRLASVNPSFRGGVCMASTGKILQIFIMGSLSMYLEWAPSRGRLPRTSASWNRLWFKEALPDAFVPGESCITVASVI